jgi:micrococcal nuclease
MGVPIIGPSREFAAVLQRVVDGDTLDLLVDISFCVAISVRVRLYGIDTPEKQKPTLDAGKAAQAFAQQWFANRAGRVLIRSYKAGTKDQYGRWLVEVWSPEGDSQLNEELVIGGYAVRYYP